MRSTISIKDLNKLNEPNLLISNQFWESLIVEHKENKSKFVVRFFHDSNPCSLNEKNKNKLLNLNYPSIIPIFDFLNNDFEDQDANGILMPYTTKIKQLSSIISKFTKKMITEKLILIYGILAGIDFLHFNNIVYGVLSSKTIFVDNDLHPFLSQYSYNFLISNDDFSNQVTLPEKKPECDFQFTNSSDIFLVGFVIYEILTNSTLDNYNEIPKSFSNDTPHFLIDFISSCWTTDPASRPTCDVLINNLDEYLQNSNINKNDFSKYFKSLFFIPWEVYISLDSNLKDKIRNASFQGKNGLLILIQNLLNSDNQKKIEVGKIILEELNQLGYKKSLYLTGKLYKEGTILGFDHNITKALSYFEKAANHGDIRSINEIIQISQSQLPKNLNSQDILSKAFQLCHRCADSGKTNAIYLLGIFYLNGFYVGKDLIKAAQYFKEAADKKNIVAILKYAEMLKNGIGVQKNEKLAFKYYQIGASIDPGECAFQYGCFIEELLIKNQRENEISEQKIQEYKEMYQNQFRIAAENLHSQAFLRYLTILKEQNNAEEVKKFIYKCAKLGNRLAMLELGKILMSDPSTREVRDEEKAVKLFKIVADEGNKEALLMYANALENGDGIKLDFLKALNIYKSLVDSKYEPAISFYNEALHSILNKTDFQPISISGHTEKIEYQLFDQSITPKQKMIVMKMKNIADSGNSIAMVNFGLLLENGTSGVIKNEKDSVKYYKMSADIGDTYGLFMYGKALEYGHGVVANEIKANYFYELAADGGNSAALDLVAKKNEFFTIKSLHFTRLAAEKGNPESLKKFVRIIKSRPKLEPNIESAMNFYKKASQIGDPIGELMYGNYLIKTCSKADSKSDDNSKLEADTNLNNNTIEMKNKFNEGLRLIKKSADRGCSEAMNTYASIKMNKDYGCLDYKEAYKYYHMSAEQNDPIGIVNTGYFLFEGPPYIEESDPIEAAKMFKKAADLGDSQGMYNFAHLLLNDIVTLDALNLDKSKTENDAEDTNDSDDRNYEEAVRLLESAANEKGHVNSMVALAHCYEVGNSVFKNINQAIDLFKKAADLNNAEAMAKYGLLLSRYYPAKLETAIKYILKSVKKNNPDGLNAYGEMILDKLISSSNDDLAKQYFNRAKKLGSSTAACNIALMYETGRIKNNDGSFIHDYEKAKQLYEKACSEDEDSMALYRIGLMKLNGHGSYEVDYDAAENYFLDAIDDDIDDAYFALGWMYEKGIKVEQSYEKAFEFYNKGYVNRSVFGCLGYGLLFSLGVGIEKDQKASENAFRDALEIRGVDHLIDLGLRFENGEAAPLDKTYAQLCFKIAADSNSERGKEHLNRISSKENL